MPVLRSEHAPLVYFLQFGTIQSVHRRSYRRCAHGRINLIKIGCTGGLSRRLRELRGIGHKPTLLGVMPGGLVEEKAIHRQFAADNARTFCNRAFLEWFASSPALLAFIERNTTPASEA